MALTLDQILKGGRDLGASDIRLIRGVWPAFRVNGEIRLARAEPLDEPTLRSLVDEITNPKQKQILEAEWQLCFSRNWPGIRRFRASVYFHSCCPEMASPGSGKTIPSPQEF